MGCQDLIIWILLLTTFVNGLPRIRYESEEDVPSTSAEQEILRRIFRNSQEMDQTGFHPEMETENRNFLEATTDSSTATPFQGPSTGPVASENKETGTTPLTSSPVVVPDGSSIAAKNAGNPSPTGNDRGDIMTKEIKEYKLEIVGEEHKKSETARKEMPVDKGLKVLAGSDVAASIGEEEQEHHLGLPMDLLPTPPEMNPPPFLLTKPFFGQTYVYQLRYPKPQQQHILMADKDYPSHIEDDIIPGLNMKNVYGPPLPVDLMKLQMKQDMELVKEGLASLPFQMSEIPGVNRNATHTSSASTPNIFMFFRTCPHHGGSI